MHTIEYAAHTAHLDPMTGEGLLVLPRPADDLRGLGLPSLHGADWGHVVAHLDGLGWEPGEDHQGGWVHAGMTSDGLQVIGLYGRDPIASGAECHRLRGCSRRAGTLAGIVEPA